MKKFLSKQGYVVYKVRRDQLVLIGGLGVCDECNYSSEYGYLIPVLNHYQCPKCFDEWNNHHTYYEEDLLFQDGYVEFYENEIGVINSFYSFVLKHSTSDFIKKSIIEAAASRGGDLNDGLASHFINFLGATVKRLPMTQLDRKMIPIECRRLLKEYQDFYLD